MSERITYIPFGGAQDKSIDYLLGILEDARYTTLQRLEFITFEELHWQYAEGWNTIGVLLSHLISIEKCFRIEFIEDRRMTEVESKEITPGLTMGEFIPQLINDKKIEDYISELEVTRKALVSSIKDMDIEDFYKRREGYNPKTGHNLAWTLYHMAEDEVHHRGQISILHKLYLLEKAK